MDRFQHTQLISNLPWRFVVTGSVFTKCWKMSRMAVCAPVVIIQFWTNQ